MLKKIFCILFALVYLLTAVNVPYAWAGLSDFFSYGSQRDNEKSEKLGQFSPQRLKQRLEYKERLLKSQTRAEEMLDRKKSKISDKVQSNINKNVQENLQNAQSFSKQAEEARNKVFSILGGKSKFNYVRYTDGKIVWFQDGLTKQVDNERVIDAQGNISIRNTKNMEYNSKNLLVSYEADTTDSLNNTTHVKWYGGTYTDDSVYYASEETKAHKLMTGYVQETTDAFGNTTKVIWSGAVYDKNDLLSEYQQVTVDVYGNQSTKDWYDAKYDSNKQITEFREIERDSLGNTRERHWTDGTYVQNPAYNKELRDKGISQTTPEYLLTGYHEEIVDENGLKIVRDWTGATYDSYGQLVSYKEILTDSLGRQTTIDWHDGQYDTYGNLLSYEQVSTDLSGNLTTILWQAESYSNARRLESYTQTGTDILGLKTVTHRTNIHYNGTGEISSYVDESVDSHGNTTVKVWRGKSFDQYGRVTSYEEDSENSLGVVIRRVWEDAQYDQKNCLLSYKEKITDSFQNVSERDWEGYYDVYGRMESYVQTDIDPFENKTLKEWRATKYDDVDRIAGYIQTVTDPDGNIAKTVWKLGLPTTDMGRQGYNQFGQLLAFEEEVTDIYGQTAWRFWNNGIYDGFGNLVSFEEVLIDPLGGETLRMWDQAVYDRFNRIVSYQETWSSRDSIQATFSPYMTHVWKAAGYDIYGRLLGCEEQNIDSLNHTTQNYLEKDIVYDNYGRKFSYLSESQGSDSIIYCTLRTETRYDSRGRILESAEKVLSSRDTDATVTNIVSNRKYDKKGRIIRGIEKSQTEGTDRFGSKINVRTMRETKDAIIVDGEVVRYVQNTLTNGIGPNGEILNNSEIMIVNGISDFSEIRVVRRISQVAEEESLDHTTVFRRQGIVRNIHGQITSYKEFVFDEATPGDEMIVERSGTVYGSQGEMLEYSERTTDLNGEISDRRTSQLQYNGLGQVVRFNEYSKRASLVENTFRTQTGYDILGRMISYHESVESPSQKMSRKNDWVALGYNEAGLLKNSYMTTQFRSDEDGVLNYSVTTSRDKIVYNRYGQMLGYNEIVKDSRTPDLTNNKNVAGITYDKFGSIATQEEISHMFGKTKQILPELKNFDLQMLQGKTLLFAGNEIKWDELSRSEVENLLKGESVIKKDGESEVKLSLSPGESTVIIVSVDLTTKIIRKNAELDTRGRLKGYTEITHSKGKDLDRTETKVRKAMVYDDRNRIVGYQDEMNSSDAPDVTTKVVRFGTVYDDLGQVTEYKEDSLRWSKDGTLDTTSKLVRTGIRYNEQGLEKEYVEDFWTDQTPLLNIKRIWSGAKYNTSGQLISFVSETKKSGKDKDGKVYDVALWNRREETAYNALGQIIKQKESSGSSAENGNETTEEVSDILYNANGQRISYTRKDEKKSGDGLLCIQNKVNRVSTVYDSEGREIGYEEVQTGSEAEGLTARVKRENVIYNDSMQVRGYEEFVTRTGKNFYVKEKVSRANMVYSQTDSLISYHEEKDSDLDGKTTRDWKALSFDGFGQITNHEESGYKTDEGNYIRKWSGSYDEKGRNVDFREEHQNENCGSTWKECKEIKYNDKGQMISYEENGQSVEYPTYIKSWNADFEDAHMKNGQIKHYKEAMTTDLGAKVEREWKEGAYNSLGQLTSYKESLREIVPDVQNKISERIWIADEGSYNNKGQLVHYEEITDSFYLDPSLSKTVVADQGLLGEKSKASPMILSDSVSKHRSFPITNILYQEKSNKVWEGATYNDQGLLKKFKESVNKKVISLPLSTLNSQLSTYLSRSDMVYDTAGHLTQYNESSENPTTGKCEKNWTALEFDNRGRVKSYKEKGYSESSGLSDLVRSNISYDDHGFILNYMEKGISDGKYVNRNWQVGIENINPLFLPLKITGGETLSSFRKGELKGVAYDALGRVVVWNETGWTENGYYEKSQSETFYNALSQGISYKEEGKNLMEGNYSKTVMETQYDLSGRRSSYHQITNEKDSGRIIETYWKDAKYNDKGQMLGYKENSTVDEKGELIESLETEWLAKSEDYSNRGKLEGFKSVSKKTFVKNGESQTVIQERSLSQFLDDGRLDGYREKVTTIVEGQNGTSESINTAVRSHTEYYGEILIPLNPPIKGEEGEFLHEGMVKSYTETLIGDQAAEKPIQHIVDDIRYDDLGRKISSIDLTAEENILAGALRRLSELFENVVSQPASPSGEFIGRSDEELNKLSNYSKNISNITLNLANLLNFSKDLSNQITNWIKENVINDLSQIVPMNNLFDSLKNLFNIPSNFLKALQESFFTLMPGFLEFTTTLKNAVTQFFPVQEKTSIPHILTETQSAYATLHSYDYSLSITKKINTVYDDNHRAVKWQEITRNSTAEDKITTSDILVTYDGTSQRYATYDARIVEGEKVTRLFRSDYTYNQLDQAISFKEMTFEPNPLLLPLNLKGEDKGVKDIDTLTIDGQTVDWNNLNSTQKSQITNDLTSKVKEVKELVTINQFENVKYNAANQMTDYDLTTYQRGYLYQDFEELNSAYAKIDYLKTLLNTQSENVVSAEKQLLERKTEWESALKEIEKMTGIKFYGETEDIMKTITWILDERYYTETIDEIAYDDSNNVLQDAYEKLKIANQNFEESEGLFNKNRQQWQDNVQSIQNLMTALVDNKEKMRTKLQIIQDKSDFIGKSNTLAASYETFLTNVENWLRNIPVSKVQEWDTQIPIDVSREVWLEQWDAEESVNTFLKETEIVSKSLNTLLENAQNQYQFLNTTVQTKLKNDRDQKEQAYNNLKTNYESNELNLYNQKMGEKNVAEKIYNDAETKIETALKQESSMAQQLKQYQDALTATQNQMDAYGGRVVYITYRTTCNGVHHSIEVWDCGNVFRVKWYAGEPGWHEMYTDNGDEVYGMIGTGDIQRDEYGNSKERMATYKELFKSKWNLIRESSDLSWNLNNLRKSVGCDFFAKEDLNIGKLKNALSGWDGASSVLRDKIGISMYNTQSLLEDQILNGINAVLKMSDFYTKVNTSQLNLSVETNKLIQKVRLGNKLDERETILLNKAILYAVYSTDIVSGGAKDYLAVREDKWRKMSVVESSYNQAKAAEESKRTEVQSAKASSDLANNKYKTLLDLLPCVAEYNRSLEGTNKSLQNLFDTGEMKSGLKVYTQNLIASLGNFKDSVVSGTLLDDAEKWKTAWDWKEICLADYIKKSGAFTRSSQKRNDLEQKAQEISLVFQRIDDAEKNVSSQKELFKQVESDLTEVFNGMVQLLTQQPIFIRQKEVCLNEEQARQLSKGESIQIDDLQIDLQKMLSSRAIQCKESLSKEETSSRQNMIYDGRGLLSKYNEISFTGKKLLIAGKEKVWSQLSESEKKDILEGRLLVRVVSDSSDIYGLTFTNVDEQLFNRHGQLVTQKVHVQDVQTISGQSSVHKYSLNTQDMVYDNFGNLLRFLRTTQDGGKTTIEKTISPTRYDGKGRLIESDMEITENTEDYSKTYLVQTWNVQYNNLNQMVRCHRKTQEDDKITYEIAIKDMQYNSNGKLLYSKNCILETDADSSEDQLAFLEDHSLYDSEFRLRIKNLDASIAKVTEVETKNMKYDHPSGNATYFVKNTWDGKKYTEENSQIDYDAKGRLTVTQSAIRETGTNPENLYAGIVYRAYQVTTDNLSFNAADLVLKQKRTVRDGTKTTIEESDKNMLYDGKGRLVSAVNNVTEQWADRSHQYQVSTEIHAYDSKNRIARQTRTALDDEKQTIESNKETEDFVYDVTGNLKKRVVNVVERSVKDGEVTDGLYKEYLLTEKFESYDAFGQVLEMNRETEKKDEQNKRYITQEKISQSYNAKGLMVESVTTRKTLEISTDGQRKDGKTNTTIMVVPSSGYNTSQQMVNFVTLTFEGDKIKTVQGEAQEKKIIVENEWKDWDLQKKESLLSGDMKYDLETTISLNFMNHVVYHPNGQMSEWIATNRVLGPVVTDFETLLQDTFKDRDFQIDEEKIYFFDRIFSKTTLLLSEEKILMDQLKSEDKLSIVNSVLEKKPLQIFNRDISGAKIRVAMDTVYVNARVETEFNSIGQVSGFKEVTLDGGTIRLNGKYCHWDEIKNVDQLLHLWESCDGLSMVDESLAKYLPNNFVTYNRTTQMTYTKEGEANSWSSLKQEIKLQNKDRLRPQEGKLFLAVNRTTSSRREETIQNKWGQDVAVKETNIASNGVETASWTFFEYEKSEQDIETNPTSLLKLTKNSSQKNWSVEMVDVLGVVNVSNRDLFGKTKSSLISQVELNEDLSQRESLKSFYDKYKTMDAFKSHSFRKTEDSLEQEDITTFEYDNNPNSPRVSKSIRVHANAMGISNVEETDYSYVTTDPKPSYTHTIYVSNPELDGQKNWSGVGGSKVHEYASLEYDSRGILEAQKTVRIDAAGIKSAEETHFTYESGSGQVTKTDKTIWIGTQEELGIRRNGDLEEPVRGPPSDFLVFNGSGGLLQREITHYQYEDEHIKETQILRTDASGVHSAEKNKFFYDKKTGQINHSIQITAEGVEDLKDFNSQNYYHTTTERKDITYCQTGTNAGRESSYTERIYGSSDAPDKITEQKVSGIVYDDFGRFYSSKTDVTEKEKLDSEREKELRTYEVTMRVGGIGDNGEKLSGYDRFGRMSDFTRTMTDRSKTTVEVVKQSYSAADGRMNHVVKEIHETGKGLDHKYTQITDYLFDNKNDLPVSEINTTIDGDRVTVDSANDLLYDAQHHLLERKSELIVRDRLNEGKILSVSHTIRKQDQGFDTLGNAKGYTTITDKNGKRLTETVKNAVYDGHGQMTHQEIYFVETVKDSSKKWSITADQTYNNLGRVETFFKKTKEEEKITDEKSLSIDYDLVGNILSQSVEMHEYDEATSGQMSDRTYQMRMENHYNNFNQVNSYVRTTIEASKTVTEDAQEIRYDVHENAVYSRAIYHEEGYDGTQKVLDRIYGLTMENSFNIYGQIASYTRITEEDKKVTEERGQNLVYDSMGRMKSSQIKFTEQDISSVIARSDVVAEFTRRSVVGDEAISISGQYLNRTYSVNTDFKDYDEMGRVLSYRRTTIEDSKTTIEDASNFKYDRSGNMMFVHMENKETGVNYFQQSKIDISNQYNHIGQIVFYKKEILENGKKIIEDGQDLSYNLRGSLESSNVTFVEKDVETNGQKHNKVYTVQMTEMTYNDCQQLSQYTRTTTEFSSLASSSFPSSPLPLGERIKVRDEGVVKITVETTLQPTEYNLNGQISHTKFQIHETGASEYGNLDQPYILETKGMGYNSLGQVARSERTTIIDNKATTEKNISNNRYDMQGRLIYSYSEITEQDLDYYNATKDVIASDVVAEFTRRSVVVDEAISSSIHAILNHTYTTLIENVTFDSISRATQTERKTVDGSRTVSETISGQTYLANDNLIRYEKKINTGEKTITETVLEDLKYDSLGRMVKSKIQVEESAPDYYQKSIRTVENSAFNSKGNLLRYKNTTLDLSLGVEGKTIIEETNEDTKYNSLGQTIRTSLTITETGTLEDAQDRSVNGMTVRTGELNQKRTVVSEISKIDENGRVIRLTLTTQIKDKTIKEESIEDQSYDSAGRVISSKNQITETGDGFNHSYMVSRTNIIYNGLDQIVRQTKTVWDRDKVVTESSQEDMTYDKFGRLLTSHDAVSEVSDSLNLFHSYEQRNRQIAYNKLGQVTESEVTIEKDPGAPDRVTRNKQQNMVYNTDGLLFSFDQVGFSNASPDVASLTKRYWTIYDSLGRAIHYKSDQGTFYLTELDQISKVGFEKYGDQKKIKSEIYAIQYDALDRMVSNTELREWGEIGGGEIPGLSGDWKCGKTILLNEKSYGGSGDRLASESCRAIGKGNHTDTGIQERGVNLGYVRGDIEYDIFGREIGSKSFTAQWTKWDLYYIEETLFSKESKEKNNLYSLIGTFSQNYTSSFDNFGRATATSTTYARDDLNQTMSTGSTDSITYNAEGRRELSKTKEVVTVNCPKYKTLTLLETALVSFIAYTAFLMVSEVFPILPSMTVAPTEYIGYVGSLISSVASNAALAIEYGAAIFGLVKYFSQYFNNQESTGPNGVYAESWLSDWRGTAFTSELASRQNEISGNRGDQKNQRITEIKSESKYIYDTYGNLDAKATEDVTRTETTNLKSEDIGWTTFAIGVRYTFKAAELALDFLPGFGPLLSYGIRMSEAAVYGENLKEAAIEGAIDTGVAYGTIYFGGEIRKFIKVAEYAKASACVAINTGIHFGASAMKSAINNERGDRLLVNAGINSMGGLTGGVDVEGAWESVCKALIITGINVGAARLKGIKEGRQLMFLTIVSASAATISFLGSSKEKDSNFFRNPTGKDFDQAAVNFASALTGIVVSRLLEKTDIAGQSQIAVLLQFSLVTMQKSGSLSSGLARSFSQGLTRGIQENISCYYQSKMQGFVIKHGPGVKPVEDQMREQSQQIQEQYKSEMQFHSAVVEESAKLEFDKVGFNMSEENLVVKSLEKSETMTTQSVSAESAKETQKAGKSYFVRFLEFVGIKSTQDETGRFIRGKNYDRVVSGKIDNSDIKLYLNGNRIVASEIMNSTGEKEIKIFDNIKIDKNGNVVSASGKIFIEMSNGEIQEGRFEYLTDQNEVKKIVKNMVEEGSELKSIFTTDKIKSVRKEFFKIDGKEEEARTIFYDKDRKVVAVEDKINKVLATYNWNVKNQQNSREIEGFGFDRKNIVYSGKIYKQNDNGKYKDASSRFIVAKFDGMTVFREISINKIVGETKSQNLIDQFIEQKEIIRQVVQDDKSGQTKYLMERDEKTGERIFTVFSPEYFKDIPSNEKNVRLFSKLNDEKEQLRVRLMVESCLMKQDDVFIKLITAQENILKSERSTIGQILKSAGFNIKDEDIKWSGEKLYFSLPNGLENEVSKLLGVKLESGKSINMLVTRINKGADGTLVISGIIAQGMEQDKVGAKSFRLISANSSLAKSIIASELDSSPVIASAATQSRPSKNVIPAKAGIHAVPSGAQLLVIESEDEKKGILFVPEKEGTKVLATFPIKDFKMSKTVDQSTLENTSEKSKDTQQTVGKVSNTVENIFRKLVPLIPDDNKEDKQKKTPRETLPKGKQNVEGERLPIHQLKQNQIIAPIPGTPSVPSIKLGVKAEPEKSPEATESLRTQTSVKNLSKDIRETCVNPAYPIAKGTILLASAAGLGGYNEMTDANVVATGGIEDQKVANDLVKQKISAPTIPVLFKNAIVNTYLRTFNNLKEAWSGLKQIGKAFTGDHFGENIFIEKAPANKADNKTNKTYESSRLGDVLRKVPLIGGLMGSVADIASGVIYTIIGVVTFGYSKTFSKGVSQMVGGIDKMTDILLRDVAATFVGVGGKIYITMRDVVNVFTLGKVVKDWHGNHNGFRKAFINLITDAVIPNYGMFGGKEWGLNQKRGPEYVINYVDANSRIHDKAFEKGVEGANLAWVRANWATVPKEYTPSGPFGIIYVLMGTIPFSLADLFASYMRGK